MNCRNLRLIPVLVAVMLAYSASCQVVIPKKCYMHLSGRINKEIQVEMNLVKINDTLYGNYTLPGNNYPDNSMDPGGKSITVYGKVDKTGNFTIKENPWNKGGAFKGEFLNAQTLIGTWENENGTKKLPFELLDKYQAGTVQLNVYYLKSSTPLLKKPKSPKATIELSMILPARSTNPILYDSIRNLVVKKFTDKPLGNTDPDVILNSIKQVYFDNYINSNADIYNAASGQSFSWVSIKFMDVVFNENNLLTFFVDHYAFTGGAHGLETRDYTVVNSKTGKIIGLADIFQADSDSLLSLIITDKIREIYKVEPRKLLTESGFFVEKVKPSPDFYITRTGIGFYYNHYEIAPYANGPSDVFLRWKEVKALLLPESPVHQLTIGN
jgi:hypothetical protein